MRDRGISGFIRTKQPDIAESVKKQRVASNGKQNKTEKRLMTAKCLELGIQHREERLSKVCEDTTDEKWRESCSRIRRRSRLAQDIWMDAETCCLSGRTSRVASGFSSL